MSRRLLALTVAGWGAIAAARGSGAPVGAVIPLQRPELEGSIAGRVCRDLDGDGQCGPAEPGVPGARVVLETGQVALADQLGRFHLVGLDARAPRSSGAQTLWLAPGRHRLTVDARGMGPGTRVVPQGATIELPIGAIAVQDFAIQEPGRSAGNVTAAYGEHPPKGVLENGRVRFLVSGKARPGDRVRIDGERAQTDPTGSYRLWKQLPGGTTVVTIQAESTDGTVAVWKEQLDVVQRLGSVLVIPRPLEPVAQVELPSTAEGAAATGEGRVRVQGKPGTRVQGPKGEVVIGPDGVAQLPVELKPGRNAVPLTIAGVGEQAHQVPLEVAAAAKPFAVGLLDLEATFGLGGPSSTRGFHLFGRGAAHGEYRLGDWELSGQLELRDQDIEQLADGHGGVLVVPRSPERFARSLDPELYPITLGDQGTTLTPNPSQGRLRVEAKNASLGVIGFGSHRGQLEGGELGRFQRALFGPYASLGGQLAEGVRVGGHAFFSPGAIDPTRALVTVPAHDELSATGGSLFYLGNGAVSEGSEELRIVVRDGLTGLPLEERHLVRGRDYELDSLSGRVLLAEPLSMAAGRSVVHSDALTYWPQPVLVADYEKVLIGGEARRTVGGEARAELGPVELSAGGAQEVRASGSYALARGRGHVALGPISLELEGAASWGHALEPGDFGLSDDGGLSYVRSPGAPAAAAGQGQALVARLRGPGLSPDGHVDAAFRWRSAEYSDRDHDDHVGFRQFSLRAEQPIGPVVVGAIADDHTGADPRDPFGLQAYGSRTLGLSVGYRSAEWELRAEAKDAQLTAGEPSGPILSVPETGGRTSVGVFGRYRLLPSLDLIASHQQTLAQRGSGPGAVADTFSSLGARYLPNERSSFGARLGWGPALGPLAWLEGEVRDGQDAFYGTYSVDVDGPDVGRARAISGARTVLGDGSAVFVEDVASHDTSEVRLSRAVGFSSALTRTLRLTARYERGARSPLAIPSALQRDSGGVTASWITERLSLFGRAELRFDRGTPLYAPGTQVSARQMVLSLGAEAAPFDGLTAAVRANYSDTVDRAVLQARLLEGTASLAYRLPAGIVVLRYAITDELLPPSRGLFGERRLQVVSLLPAFHLGSRFTLSAGGNAGWSTEAGATALVLTGSLRPAVRIVGGLELAAEVARRSVDVDNQGLTSLRGEVGYLLDERFRMAVGVTVFGYSGLGFPSTDPTAQDPGQQDRLYLRAELAY